jgi:hypothetical protein
MAPAHMWQGYWLVPGSSVGLLTTVPFHVVCDIHSVAAGFQEFPKEGRRTCQSSERLSLELPSYASFSSAFHFLTLNLDFPGKLPLTRDIILQTIKYLPGLQLPMSPACFLCFLALLGFCLFACLLAGLFWF